MSFNRFSVLCTGGLWCVLALGCSQAPSGQTQPGSPVEQKERSDTQLGSDEDDSPHLQDGATTQLDQAAVEPLKIDKIKLWDNVLEKPAVFVANHKQDEKGKGYDEYKVTVQVAPVQMLPKDLPTTQALTYGGKVQRDGVAAPEDNYQSSPGPTFEMTRGTRAQVTWDNQIQGKNVVTVPDSSIPAGTNGKVPIVTHVHGLEVAPASDGAPTEWFTSDAGKSSVIYDYPNTQPATGLWYHDHTIHMTQYNVYAGLAGAYFIRDSKADPAGLPDSAHEWPLVLQDRSFKTDGSLDFNGSNLTNVINGKVWPQLEVDRGLYRFRLINGSNGRYYELLLSDMMPITVIGSDGGYLPAPKSVTSLKLAPGERADILVDFSEHAEGDFVFLTDRTAGVAQPLNQLVRFKVTAQKPPAPEKLPKEFTPLPDLANGATPPVRTMTLHGGAAALLNGQDFHGLVSETPTLNTTEDWDLVNLTGGAHPIHLHLVQFQVQSRKVLKTSEYQKAWTAANGSKLPLGKPTVEVPVLDTYTNGPLDLTPIESGWKDTVDVPGNSVTRIRVRWAPQEPEDDTSKDNPFRFDPTVQPGYVWHCHILRHEDNDMMRPLLPQKPPVTPTAPSDPLN